MWEKQSKLGLRVIALFMLLALVVSPLAAWPFSLTKKSVETPYQVQTSQAQQGNSEDLALIQSLKATKIELENKLKEQQRMLDTLSKNLEASGTKISDTKSTAESLLKEIENLKGSLEISETSYKSLKTDYDALAEKYELKVVESDGYFKDLASVTAKYNAIENKPKESKWSTTIGGAAVFDKGVYGIDAMLGIGYGPVTVFGGATYMLDGDAPLDFLKLDSYTYKAGLQYTF